MINFATVRNRFEKKVLNQESTIENFIKDIEKRVQQAIVFDKEKTEAFIASKFINEDRLTTNIFYMSMLVLDVDNNTETIKNQFHLEKILYNIKYKHICYSTSSNSLKKPRARIVIFLKNAVNKDSYKNVAKRFIDTLDKDLREAVELEATLTINKLWTYPVKQNEDTCLFFVSNDGELLDLDNYLEERSEVKTELISVITKEPLSFTKQEIIRDLQVYKVENCDNNRWFEVIAALHHQFSGSQEGLYIADDWSKLDRREGQYQGIQSIEKIWNRLTLENKDFLINWYMVKKRIRDLNISATKILTKIEPYLFPEPNLSINADGKKKYLPKISVNNVEFLFEYYNIKFRYNMITKDVEAIYKDVLITNIDTIVAEVIGMFSINNFSTKDVRLYITTCAKKNEFNEFKEFVLSKSWDNVDRLEQLYKTIIVDKEHEKLRNIYLKHWLLELMKLTCFNDGDVYQFTKSVLIFQCAKYSTQKTEWFNYLFPAQYRNKFFHDGAALRLNDSMSKLECLSVVVCELGEMGQTLRKVDSDALKAFISSRQDVLNRKYAISHQRHRRMTIFCGSTNDYSFLDNKEGNGRFLVLPIKQCIAHHNIDMQQIYAQLYTMYEKDGFYMLTDDDLLLKESVNQGFTYECPFTSKLLKTFDFDSLERTLELTASEILEALNYSQEYVTRNRKDVSKIKTICFEHNLRFKANTKTFLLPPFKNQDNGF